MNGYQYLVERNRLMQKLEADLARLTPLTEAERAAARTRLEAEFDRNLAEIYAKVAGEYPGERRKRARPIDNSR
jgi:hypothetical protein